MSYVPTKFYHDAPNPFTLYGFHYKSMAHYLVVQMNARRGLAFEHFFEMHVDDLPYIHCVQKKVLDEGLGAMLPKDMEMKNYKYPISHDLLGIGTTRFRLKYGDKPNGKNAYGKAMKRVLKRRILKECINNKKKRKK